MIMRSLLLNLPKNAISNKHFVSHRQISSTSIDRGYFKKFYRKFMANDDSVTPPYSHCTQVGDPVLRQIAPEVPPEHVKDKEIEWIVNQMKKVLSDYNLVGLAAPQIGISLRIILLKFGAEMKKRYSPEIYAARQMETLPLTVCINPAIKITNYNEKTFPEGCASVCGYIADVCRYEEVLLSGYNENGEHTEIKLKGWNARIAQHEVDHLNGKIFVDIMEKKSFTCATWEAVNAYRGQIHIPFYPKKKLMPRYLVR